MHPLRSLRKSSIERPGKQQLESGGSVCQSTGSSMSKTLVGKADPRFLREEGPEVYTGTELLVKGLLETEGGTHLWTGYPGSPVAGFFDTVETIAELLYKARSEEHTSELQS